MLVAPFYTHAAPVCVASGAVTNHARERPPSSPLFPLLLCSAVRFADGSGSSFFRILISTYIAQKQNSFSNFEFADRRAEAAALAQIRAAGRGRLIMNWHRDRSQSNMFLKRKQARAQEACMCNFARQSAARSDNELRMRQELRLCIASDCRKEGSNSKTVGCRMRMAVAFVSRSCWSSMKCHRLIKAQRRRARQATGRKFGSGAAHVRVVDLIAGRRG